MMQNVQTGKERQQTYSSEYRRLKKALGEEFYLEAIFISYAIVEDRLIAFLHHAGIVSRQHEQLKINKPIIPYVRLILGIDNKKIIQIRSISTKMSLVQELIALTQARAEAIDSFIINSAETSKKKAFAQKGYMQELEKHIAHTISAEEGIAVLKDLHDWCQERNRLIHALMNKTISSSEEARKECAERGYQLSRKVDELFVKPFKKNNRIRKQFNIQ